MQESAITSCRRDETGEMSWEIPSEGAGGYWIEEGRLPLPGVSRAVPGKKSWSSFLGYFTAPFDFVWIEMR